MVSGRMERTLGQTAAARRSFAQAESVLAEGADHARVALVAAELDSLRGG